MSVFENKNRTGNSASVWLLVLPPPPSNAKVFPSSSKHIQSNSGQYSIFENEGQIEKKKTKTPATLPVHTRTEDPGRSTRSVSRPQVIAILAAVASPTLLQAATQLAGFSLGRRAGAEEGLERSRRGSSPGNTVQAPGHSDGLGHGESWRGSGGLAPLATRWGGFGGPGVLLLPTMPKTKQVPAPKPTPSGKG